jgi:hypothetical protein
VKNRWIKPARHSASHSDVARACGTTVTELTSALATTCRAALRTRSDNLREVACHRATVAFLDAAKLLNSAALRERHVRHGRISSSYDVDLAMRSRSRGTTSAVRGRRRAAQKSTCRHPSPARVQFLSTGTDAHVEDERMSTARE